MDLLFSNDYVIDLTSRIARQHTPNFRYFPYMTMDGDRNSSYLHTRHTRAGD